MAEAQVHDRRIVPPEPQRRRHVLETERLDAKEGAQPEPLVAGIGAQEQDIHDRSRIVDSMPAWEKPKPEGAAPRTRRTTRSKAFAKSFVFTAAKPPLSSASHRKLSCDRRRSLLSDCRLMSRGGATTLPTGSVAPLSKLAKLLTPIASSPAVVRPRGSIA